MFTKTNDSRHETGQRAETFAAQYVERTLGWKIWKRNWRCKRGELDIVCLDRETLVFVEVRARSTDRFGDVRGAVDVRKARKIVRLATLLLQQWEATTTPSIRFDVILLAMCDLQVVKVHHVRGAFDALT